MNIYQLRALIAQLKKEDDSSNNELIAFYKRKEKEMLVLIQDKINVGLKGGWNEKLSYRNIRHGLSL